MVSGAGSGPTVADRDPVADTVRDDGAGEGWLPPVVTVVVVLVVAWLVVVLVVLGVAFFTGA